MAVYREGYMIINNLQKFQKQIWNDACDIGVPMNPKDKTWYAVKQLCDWYSSIDTHTENEYGTTCIVELLDEWAVSDKRKTKEEALDRYKVTVNRITTKHSLMPYAKGFKQFVTIQKIN